VSAVAVADVAHLAPVEDGVEWHAVRHHFGIRAFGVNAWSGHEAGAQIIEDHDEVSTDDDPAGHEELYVVLSGTARFTVAGETFDAPAGSLVHVGDPATRRQAVDAEPGTTVLAVGAAPGVAYDVSPWERRWIERAEAAGT
jgi:mannose-6-phosphate isomerase-like protein (cupin superfamily)